MHSVRFKIDTMKQDMWSETYHENEKKHTILTPSSNIDHD